MSLLDKVREFAVLNSRVRMLILTVLSPHSPASTMTYSEIEEAIHDQGLAREVGIMSKNVNLQYHLARLVDSGYLKKEPFSESASARITPKYSITQKGENLFKK